MNFKAYKYNPKQIHDIAALQPKVILLSSNNVKNTIQLYIDYLEEYEQNIAPHSAVLLISNRETLNAYLACENGLFDNYVIINPLNEPYRLKLVLMQELHMIESYQRNSIEQLISEGEEQLASCIEHGVALKKSFVHKVNKCSDDILSATNSSLVNIKDTEAKIVLQNLIGISIEEMNDNLSADIQGILDQLNELKASTQLIKQGIEKQSTLKKKTIDGVNTELLTTEADLNSHKKTSRYKVLIAESSNLFADVIDKIFSETLFKYTLVNDGQEALSQIKTFKPDVALIAYDLPTINGLDITKIIREEGSKLPIVAYIHNRDKAVINDWIPLGLSGYIQKPSKKSVIINSITQAVNNPVEILFHNKDSDKAKAKVEWNEEYSVGNKDMDEQHKALFAMVNEFFQQESKQAAIIIFDSLATYIDLHFESEENLLKQINYPTTAEHIKQHGELRKSFNGLRKKLDDYSIDIQHKISIFLYNWLAQHILKADMEYKFYAESIEEDSFINKI